MELNNKGFAISSIMYIILIMCIILITVTLSILSSRNLILDKQKKNALSDIYMYSESFEKDDWKTIVTNVKAGNLSNYHVGDTKEVDLGEFGKHTLRIANTTTPDECNTEGFSQTACGFVIEFADVIINRKINSNTNVGGWKDSEIRVYVNDTIYNLLPIEIKNNIINTYVVSGHGNTSGETNFETIDKLYLLSTKEVWGKEGTSNTIAYDTAEAETRQLDYYKSMGATTNNYSGVIKNYDESEAWWWLRSAYSNSTYAFYYVYSSGSWGGANASDGGGISPAFRIG